MSEKGVEGVIYQLPEDEIPPQYQVRATTVYKSDGQMGLGLYTQADILNFKAIPVNETYGGEINFKGRSFSVDTTDSIWLFGDKITFTGTVESESITSQINDAVKPAADKASANEGAIKVLNETTIPGLDSRIKTLEDNPYELPSDVVQDANYKHITVTENSVSDGDVTFTKYDDTALAGRVSVLEAKPFDTYATKDSVQAITDVLEGTGSDNEGLIVRVHDIEQVVLKGSEGPISDRIKQTEEQINSLTGLIGQEGLESGQDTIVNRLDTLEQKPVVEYYEAEQPDYTKDMFVICCGSSSDLI